MNVPVQRQPPYRYSQPSHGNQNDVTGFAKPHQHRHGLVSENSVSSHILAILDETPHPFQDPHVEHKDQSGNIRVPVIKDHGHEGRKEQEDGGRRS